MIVSDNNNNHNNNDSDNNMIANGSNYNKAITRVRKVQGISLF